MASVLVTACGKGALDAGTSDEALSENETEQEAGFIYPKGKTFEKGSLRRPGISGK